MFFLDSFKTPHVLFRQGQKALTLIREGCKSYLVLAGSGFSFNSLYVYFIWEGIKTAFIIWEVRYKKIGNNWYRSWNLHQITDIFGSLYKIIWLCCCRISFSQRMKATGSRWTTSYLILRYIWDNTQQEMYEL